MIVDASAILAVVRQEEDMDLYLPHLMSEEIELCVSAIGWWEVNAKVISVNEKVLTNSFDKVNEAANFRMIPVDHEQTNIAIEAFRRFGKGRHKAKLNMGDCFAYALAKARNDTLLFKGEDFTHTDVRPAL